MGTKYNKYVGARYVPIFDGDWDKTKSYEPLVIVMWKGNSYTSKTYVPSNVEIDDKKYWANTGNYNAQVEDYKNIVKTFDDRIEKNKDKINENRNLIENLNTNVETTIKQIQQDITKNTDNIDKNKKEIERTNKENFERDVWLSAKASNNLSDKNFILLGDSYNDGEGGIIGRGWGHYFAEFNKLKKYKSIQQRAGGYFAKGSQNADYPNKKFWECIEIYANTLTDNERLDVDYIVVGGGYNDARDDVYDADGIIDGVTKFKQKCDEYFPNAKIWEIPLFNAGKITHWERIKGFDAVLFACQQNGIACTKNSISWLMGRSKYMASDEIHLSDDGYRLVAKYMTAVINGWNGEFSFSTNADLSLGRGISIPDRLYCMRDGDMCVLQGSVKNVHLLDGDVLFTIPPECQPKKRLTISAYGTGGAHMVICDITDKCVVRGHTGTAQIETEICFCHTWKVGY